MYSRILKHSYTAEEYIEWIPAKNCNKKNKPSNKILLQKLHYLPQMVFTELIQNSYNNIKQISR